MARGGTPRARRGRQAAAARRREPANFRALGLPGRQTRTRLCLPTSAFKPSGADTSARPPARSPRAQGVRGRLRRAAGGGLPGRGPGGRRRGRGGEGTARGEAPTRTQGAGVRGAAHFAASPRRPELGYGGARRAGADAGRGHARGARLRGDRRMAEVSGACARGGPGAAQTGSRAYRGRALSTSRGHLRGGAARVGPRRAARRKCERDDARQAASFPQRRGSVRARPPRAPPLRPGSPSADRWRSERRSYLGRFLWRAKRAVAAGPCGNRGDRWAAVTWFPAAGGEAAFVWTRGAGAGGQAGRGALSGGDSAGAARCAGAGAALGARPAGARGPGRGRSGVGVGTESRTRVPGRFLTGHVQRPSGLGGWALPGSAGTARAASRCRRPSGAARRFPAAGGGRCVCPRPPGWPGRLGICQPDVTRSRRGEGRRRSDINQRIARSQTFSNAV